ncbi:Adenylate and Guanylate cyclase catalytic domain containing protein, putative [Trypanosoma equiperdum]|uniref:adenylate cyclase n=1 Tax=Trypanosoma equiperdum TaxID=5694 RepID=A0A1G4IDZ3_TRYEQ|nr:Adenylate and Guanylate cyclase catalytic domain containing protein, putative [Trypanosoma equiperdum]
MISIHQSILFGRDVSRVRMENSPVPCINQFRCRLTMSSLSLLLVFLVVVMPPVEALDNITVKVYSLLYHPFVGRRLIDSMNAGFNASMAARQWTVAPGINVEVIHPASYRIPGPRFLQRAINDNKDEFFVVVGPMGDGQLAASRSFLQKENLVAFAPSTGASSVRGWSPNIYFLRVSPTVELIALMRFAVTHLRLLRIGFMYLQGLTFGDSEYEVAIKLMSHLGRELCGVFTVASSHGKGAADSDFDAVWDKFVVTRPQGVIMFAPPAKDVVRFVVKMLNDSRTQDAYFLASSVLELTIASWSGNIEAANTALDLGQIVLSRTNPLATDTQYQAIRRFQDDARSYLSANPGVTIFSGADDFEHHYVDGKLMVYGWIVGEVLSQALRSRAWIKDRETFKKSLYSQRRYVVDELVFGDFGGECEGTAGERGAVCNCNQGGNVVYINVAGRDNVLEVIHDGQVVVDSSLCYHDEVRLHSPVNGLLVFMQDDPVAQNAAEEIYDGAIPLTGDGRLGQTDRFFLHMLTSETAEASSELESELGTRAVTAVFGVADDAMLSLQTTAFIDPISLLPGLPHRGRKVIYLSPTLEQQLFALVKYFVGSGSTVVHAVVCRGDVVSIERLLYLMLMTFGGHMGTVVGPDSSTDLEGSMPETGDVLVIGLSKDDVAVVASHLDRNPDVRVAVLFFDVALLYIEFVKAFKSSSSGGRLLFATSLPHWAEANSTSATVQKFHAAVPDSPRWTPLSLLGFATGRFIQTLLFHMDKVTPDSIINAIYTLSVVNSDDMRYGPFVEERCPSTKDAPEGGDHFCGKNYGARRLSVWSMDRALNASVAPLTSGATPSLVYIDPYSKVLSGGRLAGVIVGVLFILLLLVALLLVLLCLRRSARDNDSAPKEPADPVTLIFTDVESSTAQWAAHPELMPDAVAAHHRLIRSLITHYRCYEVKTVGDSFMIACKSAFAASSLAQGLQQRFFSADWGTSAFDESYREFEQQRADDDNEYKPPSARLDPEVYRSLWKGLRVRIGIHTGLCEIRQDEVTKGYDYYGKVTDMAARTESVANGGQVVLTQATYFALSTAEREQFDVVSLGRIPLAGAPQPMEVYQLNAVPGRTFAALRLDREFGDDFEDRMSTSTGDSSSLRSGMNGTTQMIASCLQAVLGTFTAAQRQKLLVPLCERWRVTLPRTAQLTWDEGFCEDVIRRISVKVGRVVDLCANSGGERTVSTLRSASVIIMSNRLREFEAEATQSPEA